MFFSYVPPRDKRLNWTAVPESSLDAICLRMTNKAANAFWNFGSGIGFRAISGSFRNRLQAKTGRLERAPVFNFRSEGRHFASSNRCIVPASAFFEFTGKKYPKAKHRFALRGSPITAIAGIWREGHGNHPPSFTMLTTAPGPDVIPYHNRQVVVLRSEDWPAWLHLTKTEAELLRPLPQGSLDVATVRKGSR
jgi:putative SOS response-associated peptidase YedK